MAGAPVPRYVLAIDAGGTKTEAELLTWSGESLARRRAGPCNLYQDPQAGLDAIAFVWNACCRDAALDPEATAPLTSLSAGLAGVSAGGAQQRFRAAFPGFARLHLSSDAYTALIGTFEARPGILLSIGTGTVGCRLGADGTFRRLGGWGFPAGDRGGGAWLGLQLVTAWLEHRDGAGAARASETLWAETERRIGSGRPAILAWLRRAGPGDFAALAPAVIAASEAGDGYAHALLDEAAGYLVRLARALEPSRDAPIALGGGLAPVLAGRLESALGADLLARDRVPSPLHGAWLVGCGRAAAEFIPPGADRRPAGSP